jgi:bacillithiol synthase
MPVDTTSSPVARAPEAPRVDLAEAGLLPPLPRAFLAGRDLDLLAPLRFMTSSARLSPAELLSPPPAASASARAATRRARADLAAHLGASNRSYGNAAADRAARRLADPATRVVITGQQPGLFGGPLLTLAKLAAAARWAAALEAEGEPAVALFWVATEDHDYAEVSTATVLTAGGPRSFDLGPDPEPLVPVGMRTLSPAIEVVLREMAAAVPGERYARWLELLGRWYQPAARFGEAFCRAVAHMLGEHCPLLVDAMHPALKAAERPWLARLVERRAALEEVLARQDEAIADRGYQLRVSPQRGASPLFLLRHGQRRRIEWQGAGGFALRGAEPAAGPGLDGRGPATPPGRGGRAAAGARPAGRPAGAAVADLLRILEDNPALVSPGVLARPAIADAVFGTTLQILGPGELSYMPQAAAVYPVLDIEAPAVALRPQALVLDARQVEQVAAAGVPLADLLGDQARLDRILMERSGGDFVAPVRQRIAAALDELSAPALAADPNLERPFARTREQVLRAIDLFAEKSLPAMARRDGLLSRRVELLRQACLPGGKLQERVICAAHFQGEYGDRLAASFWEQLDLDPAALAVVVP